MRISDWSSDVCSSDLRWLVTCTAFGARHLRGLAEAPDRIHLLYHGLDLGRFAPAAPAAPGRDGSDPAAPVRLLSVGRPVAKRGFDVLLAALEIGRADDGTPDTHAQHVCRPHPDTKQNHKQ